ncbi:MAG TPA: FtsW/RodA/SpoVE family cell cycle protein [Candidatus Agathobaculum intestinigallinarum]|nr:FtsW/RodA/SpoVE family cell cycle protein [Candidatus Agathobaculum intestinigallinarum]
MPLPEHVRGYLIRLLERDAAERAQTTAELDALARAAEVHQARPLPDVLRGWLNNATGQMRWKRARPVAAKELADHLSDQYEAFLDEGMDEDAAAEATAREMGDAVETGTLLDRAWRPQPDWVMLGIVLLVAAVGKVVQYLLGMNPANEVPILATTQVGIYLYGVVFLFAGYFLDYTIFGRHCKLLYALWCVVGLLMTFGPLQRIQSGANISLRRWVWFFPVLFAGILYGQRGKGTAGIRNCLLSMIGLWFFAMFAPSTSALCVLTTVCCGMLFAAVWRGAFGKRTKGKMVLSVLPLLVILAFGIWLIFNIPHLWDHVAILFHPQVDAMYDGFQGSVIQNIMFGIPAPEIEPIDPTWLFTRNDGIGDWILATAKLQFGWAGFLILLGLEVLFLVWGFRLARRQTGLLARSVCMGVMATFALQTAMYVLQNFGFMLLSAYGLPLLSYGANYLLQTMFLLGVLLSAQRTGQLESGLAPAPALERKREPS